MKYFCKLHPKKQCRVVAYCPFYLMDNGWEREQCPWPSRQQDPPPVRTNHDVAREILLQPTSCNCVVDVLRAFHIDPNAEYKGEK